MSGIGTISATELAAILDQGDDIFLLDVREQGEWDTCSIPGNILISLGQIPGRLNEIPKDKLIVAYCHHGRRSERALQFLQQQGFGQLRNLQGGIDAWAIAVDPGMTRY